MDSTAEELVKISDSLFSKKLQWNQLCQTIAFQFYPLRSDFTRTFTLGTDFSTGIMDGSTTNARETLGNAIDSMLRQGDWFQVGTGDRIRDQQEDNATALAYATRKLKGIVEDARSNFRPAVKEGDMDWVSFGQPVFSVEASAGRNYIIFKPWHPRDCAWLVNDDKKVDVNHRKIYMQARNIKRKFDEGTWTGTMHPDITKACQKQPDQPFDIRHILMPMDEAYGSDPKKMRQMRHKYLSLYIDMEHRCILNEAPSRIFNYVLPGWKRLGDWPQGFSPAAINSLPDARMLQDMARVILEQGEKAVDPPIVGSGEIFTRDINLYAGGFTYVDMPAESSDLRQHMTTVDTGQGLPMGLQLKQDVRSLITDAWLLNKLFLPDLREMTAYEAAQRTEEFRRAALPFFTPIQSEYHSPLLGTAFDLGCNMGLIDVQQFPPALHGQDIVFQFASPLEAAEGAMVVKSYQEAYTIISTSAQLDPTIANIFNIRQGTVDAVRGAGAPPEWILSGQALAAQNAKDAATKNAQDVAGQLREGAAVAQDLSSATAATQQSGLLPKPGVVPQQARLPQVPIPKAA